MPFNHTTYAHRTGRRSRPRDDEQMAKVLAFADMAVARAEATRKHHRGKDRRGRAGALETARARLEAAMVPIRQESARCSKDRARRAVYGDELKRRTAAARAEKRRLMKMLGHWR